MTRTLTLQRALLGIVAAALLAGVVPAGVVLDRRLAGALEARARADLALAPRVFGDRQAMSADAHMMHAKEFAQSPELADALARADRGRVRQLADDARAAVGGEPVVIGPAGDVWEGPASDAAVAALLPRTRAGEFPVVTVAGDSGLRDLALAPVAHGGRWVGAAGLVAPLGAQEAGVLSGLTRADVVIVGGGGGAGRGAAVAATTLDTATTRRVVAALDRWRPAGQLTQTAATVHELAFARRRLIATAAPIAGAGTVVFVRDLATELAVVPELRRLALVSAAAALLLALAVGAALAARLGRPVRQLAGAADALARGDFDAPLPRERALAVREVARVSTAFQAMRAALAARLDELRAANEALADRNARLTALQADLVQRERLAASGRLVTQLAHEIRNPVASLRNCLELIRRRVAHDPEAREFADLAIDELLRMHELAEQMLDLNRPRDAGAGHCRPARVAQEVAALLTAGAPRGAAPVRSVVRAPDAAGLEAAIAPDALKQVLLNLAQNAREAIGAVPARADVAAAAQPTAPGVEIGVERAGDAVLLTVTDDGPGIPAHLLPRIFDPFFTTKADMHGVGLGLFVAEGLVRGAGGRLTAENRVPATPNGAVRGAVFRVELPAWSGAGAPEPAPAAGAAPARDAHPPTPSERS